MLQKTKGIVINYVKYRETSVIVSIYTEAFGMRTYIENGMRSSKAKNKIALLQPLTMLDLVVFENDQKAIKRISEMKCLYAYQQIPYQINKSSMALFVAELLKKCLKEEVPNSELYIFLEQSFFYLDKNPNTNNFHLVFLVKLMAYLGFAPTHSATVFEEFQNVNFKTYNSDLFQHINTLISADYTLKLPINRTQKLELLDMLLSFYRIHIAEFGQLNSHWVLKEVLD
jgi:DNA repair protein RecO (recombination protein O)